MIGAVLVSGCSSLKGGLIGGTAGAAVGAGLGILLGNNAKSAAVGAAIGTAVGGTAGAIIGHKMDKKAAELEALENAKVETVTDINGLQAIKVTFDSGILFKSSSAALSDESKKTLSNFAVTMQDLTDTDITILGHTDNTGSDALNDKLSRQRAESVSAYLQSCGIAASRLSAHGKSYSMPVADNSTPEGRALNRRVEVYVSANEAMIKAAQAGTLK